jgi:hypothetical protein
VKAGDGVLLGMRHSPNKAGIRLFDQWRSI